MGLDEITEPCKREDQMKRARGKPPAGAFAFPPSPARGTPHARRDQANMANPNPSPETRFKPGQVANPTGKSAEQAARDVKTADLASQFRHKMLSSVMEKIEAGEDVLDLATPDLIRVLKDSEDRAHGSPKAAVDHTSSDGSMTPKGLDVSKMSDAALAELHAALNADADPDAG